MLLTVRMEEFGAWTVLHAAGEIDMSSGPLLRNELIGQMHEGRMHLALELSAVDFIDSTGLGVLIGGRTRARKGGGDLCVVGAGLRLRDIFQLTGLEEHFPPFATLHDLPIVRGNVP